MFVLTDTERLAILSGCLGLLGFVMLITACFACPFCWLYKKISSNHEKGDMEKKCMRNHFQVNFLDKEPPPPYDSPTRFPMFDMKPSFDFSRRLTSVNSVSSVGSDTDSVAGIPLPLLSDAEMSSIEVRENIPVEPGHVSITLQYKRIVGDDKKVFTQLRMDLKEATDLPFRSYGGRSNPYFIIGLYDMKSLNRKKRRKSGPIPLHEFHSTVVKKSQHPVYNESFFFPLEQNEIKKCTLKIEAWDRDKLANDSILGVVYFNLKDVASFLLQEPSKELDLSLKLEDSKTNNGQILLGLCYLPTAERMTVAVLKANNLKRINEKSDEADYYVQAMAIYGGKVFERRKTSSRPSSSFPIFNEMLMFDVPISKLDYVVLLLAVRTISPAMDSDKETQMKTMKESCVGKVVIGSCSRKNTLNHWNAMRNSPRRQVIQWHELR
ncbi:synaptotagmin-C-like [Uloborus diversus]|uniref:synaptotagmin-C-like n=1 Tax=Uloborus diversus TaxID=327109 RepID=UPI00240907D6|nr:synaptotagmin-C-like [Uloborus diversus]